jgi:uncharacterized SAM-binding protein YcdF (DUF218 family)
MVPHQPLADAVVVLGAALREADVAPPAVIRRVRHGARVLKETNAPFLVVSGGIVGPPPAEAVIMRSLALDEGIADSRIIVEAQSRNTFENAVYSGRIMRERGWKEMIIVTDAFHMPRALFTFRRLGLAVTGAPVRERGNTSLVRWYASYLREAAAFAKSAGLFLIGAHKPLIATVWRP